jgi:hypothetical protein
VLVPGDGREWVADVVDVGRFVHVSRNRDGAVDWKASFALGGTHSLDLHSRRIASVVGVVGAEEDRFDLQTVLPWEC